jgi:NAD(P)H-dependent FMN reductase
LNAIEWLSRPPGRSVLRGRPVVVLSTSPGPGAGAHAAEDLARVLRHVGAEVIGTLSVPRGFGRIADGRPDATLAGAIDDLVAAALDRAARHAA